MGMKIVSSGQKFHCSNQIEQRLPFASPGRALNNIARLQTQIDAGGLRSTLYPQARFALIRLMTRAKISQRDNARYRLSWSPDQNAGPTLSVQLRAESGAGPLDILTSRNFTSPARICETKSFVDRSAGPNPPLLPPGAFIAARKAGVPLPGDE
ncbi:type VI secretion IcmF C-terminal domain-containing protein [Caballeronia fortuita]